MTSLAEYLTTKRIECWNICKMFHYFLILMEKFRSLPGELAATTRIILKSISKHQNCNENIYVLLIFKSKFFGTYKQSAKRDAKEAFDHLRKNFKILVRSWRLFSNKVNYFDSVWRLWNHFVKRKLKRIFLILANSWFRDKRPKICSRLASRSCVYLFLIFY